MILHFFKKCLCYQHFLCHSCLSFHYTLQFRLLLILFSSSCFFNKPVVYFFHVSSCLHNDNTPTSRNYFHEKFTPYFKQSISYFNGQQKSPVLTNRALCIILHLQALLSHQFQPPKRVSPPRYIPLSSAQNRNDILCKCLPLCR